MDDWDKAVSFDAGTTPRRSTSSLDDGIIVVPNRTRLIWLGAVAAMGVVAVVLDYQSSMAFRARRYFAIPWTQRVNPDSIKDGVARVVPLGTPVDQVGARLKRVGIGADGLSGYYALPSGSDSVIRLAYDPRHFALVQAHYGIMLHFDAGVLRQVRVEPWFTGL